MPFKHFLKKILPWRGDGPRQTIFKLLFLALLAVAAACAVRLGFFARDYFSELNMQKNIDSLYKPSAAASSSAVSAASSSGPSRSFDSLLKINSDVQGWIKIPHTEIDNVVARSKDNAYYLHHSLYKKYDRHGTLFLDYRDRIRPMSRNLIIYGHHMADGSMFHDLIKYKKAGFYNQSPVIDFDTLYAGAKWKIFAVFIVNVEPKDGKVFQYLYTDFGTGKQFMDFITQVRRRSLLDTGVDVKANDKILTLSTCTYEIHDARLVVMARLVRAGESDAVSKGVRNPHPLMPDAWYKKYGGTKPTFASSETQGS